MSDKRSQMTPTALSSLALIAGVAVLFGLVIALSFYGDLGPINVVNSSILWIIAAMCLAAAVVVRKKIADGMIGLDRSQMNPMTVATWMNMGKAAGWVGAGFAGAYAGVGIYVMTQYATLTAAQDDTPGVVAFVLGGLACAAAGVFLERSCVAPPSDSDADGVRGMGRASGVE
ncbi:MULTISPECIES: DUF3180 domain-containing protein [Corynebacterium]|uniref:DUF3180 domain-containing protein n=1 Tax=Corynebacterium TaxID=1716 RepID=UPI001CE3BF0C|nr:MULTISPECIES: DUF3180 domain-containing protein [Corynebacterium]